MDKLQDNTSENSQYVFDKNIMEYNHNFDPSNDVRFIHH